MEHNLDELKLLIANKMEIPEFLDLLQINIYELVELLEEQIAVNADELERALR